MEASDGENTDASSIKPVSSLRSHFEGMASSKTSKPIATSTRAVGIPPHIEPERGRSSLDVSRRGLAWNVSTQVQSGGKEKRSNTSGSTISRSVENGNVSRQRPVSMGPLSPPRTPPVVQVISPHNSTRMPLMPPPSAFSPGNTVTKSPNPPAVPPARTPNRSPRPSAPIQPSSISEPASKPTSVASSSQVSLGATSSMPPPVNRADKPKLPSKRSTADSQTGWRSLEPVEATKHDRVSPFSTPPSSAEGSPEIEHRGMNVIAGIQASKPASRTRTDSYFPPPPTHHTVEAKREARNTSTPYTSRSRNAKDNGFNSGSSHSLNLSDQAPVLSVNRVPLDLESDPTKRSDSIRAPQPRRTIPMRPHAASQVTRSSTDFLPPPRRSAVSGSQAIPSRNGSPAPHLSMHPPSRTSSDLNVTSHARAASRRVDTNLSESANSEHEELTSSSLDYPEATQTNRRPPHVHSGTKQIDTRYETRLFDICGKYVCTTGYITRVWDLVSGKLLIDMSHGEREIKITALAFKPSLDTEEEGLRVWLGSNFGDIQELDLITQGIAQIKPQAHARREILRIYRHQNSMWSLDDDGKLHVWSADDQGLPNLQGVPIVYRVTKGHTYSIVIGGQLWLATGRELRVFRPGATGDDSFYITQQPLLQPNTGEITSGAVISSQLQHVYFGHTDGKVSIYSSADYRCLSVVNVSVYKINTLAGAGDYLWAGYNTGMIYVYDTRTQPWAVKKDWLAHDNPVLSIVADRSCVWKLGDIQVTSIGVDNAVRMWDGMLEDDWLESDMHQHDTEYCEFREITTVVATWNAGATTPSSLRHEDKDNNFFREVIQTNDPPDILIFGFQELVDLEDKRLTAKSLFMGNKKKDSSEQDHMSHQYRAWRDFLVRVIEDNMASNQPYHLLHTANMVGLFSCVFIKASLRTHVRNLQVVEVKRGLGGLHGNKGALILRFVLDDTSLCFVNCHLAAGQTHTVQRNSDITAILDASSLPVERDPFTRLDNFVGGGDGSMIMDHEICVINGDLNYRIDTMGRDTVVKAIKANNLARLLERDQLLVSRRRNPGFRLRAFHELPITFAPTYKYDVGTDNYDSSEKHRSPAWCDRLLYRGVGRIKQLDYRRHELRISDHRPVSGVFKMRIKSISPKKRVLVWQQCQERFIEVKRKLEKEVKIDYLVNVLGVSEQEALGLI
ncbi:hypothetical protein MMC18_003039 [Xylographa bjoerkii]|nr:hypothetical protein [Xylographa bjoerkii]